MSVKTYRRGFLNKKKGMAAFTYDVNRYDEVTAYGSFDITDCTRHISLNFNYENKKEKDDAIYKVNALIKELTVFKQKLFA